MSGFLDHEAWAAKHTPDKCYCVCSCDKKKCYIYYRRVQKSKKKELIILNLQDDTFEWRVNVACADMLLYSERDNKKNVEKNAFELFSARHCESVT